MKCLAKFLFGKCGKLSILGIAICFGAVPTVTAGEGNDSYFIVDPVFEVAQNDINNSDSSKTLEEVSIFAPSPILDLGAPSLELSEQRIKNISGGANVIDAQLMRESAVLQMEDALEYIPGVYIGSKGVAEGTKIQIRGSGVRSGASPIRGVSVFRNGIPLSRANGATDTQIMNFNVWDHVEVKKGANALSFGSSNLGGAINVITHTGRTAPGFNGRITFGSFNYKNPVVSYGWADEKWDAYASFSYYESMGFRQIANTNDNVQGFLSTGYRWNSNNETRLIVDIQDHRWENSTTLTLADLRADPTRNNRSPVQQDFKIPSQRVSLRHNLKTEDWGQFSIGTFYMRNDFRFPFNNSFGVFEDLWQETGVVVRNERTSNWFGKENHIEMGLNTQYMWIVDEDYNVANNEKSTLQDREEDRYLLLEAYFQDRISIAKDFDLVLGVQGIYKRQEYTRTFPQYSNDLADSAGWNPKVGLIWQVDKEVQVYGNVSRSFQAKTLNNSTDINGGNPVKDQTATTVEIGTRGGSSLFSWEANIYHSWVEDELLVVESPPQSQTFLTGNADDSLHTGIELGMESIIPMSFVHAGDNLRVRGSYTWSNFRFDEDISFGSNTLPGIPEHVGLVEVMYQHSSGLYFGPNVEVNSPNTVDFANTLEAPAWAVLGLRAGYKPKKSKYLLFLEAKNITDEAYAQTLNIANNSGGADAARFTPGSPFSMFGGVEYRF
jgi:iron complex outermembrane recepter protein